MTTRPALRLVDPETGELHSTCPDCAEAQDVISGLERTLRSQASTIAKLQRDRESDAKADPLYPAAQALHDHWRKVCRHPKAKFDVADFEQCRPMLKRHGEAMCRKAIDGAGFDCFTDQRRNGSTRRHDSWELIFRSPSKTMEFANRAPREGQA